MTTTRLATLCFVGGLIAASAFALVGCGNQQVQLTTLDTCSTEAATVSALADVKSHLTVGQVAAVNKDIAIVDPVCSAATPQTALTGAAQSAADELASILVGAK